MIRLPEEVARLLDDASRRIRRILVLRGLVVTGAVFLALALAAMATDAFCVIFDDRLRALLSLGVWGLTALVAVLAVLRPFLRPVSRRKAARVLDERHPETEERFSTLVEIAERGADAKDNTSEGLFAKLGREGVICANRIVLADEFTARTIRRRLIGLGAVVGLLLLSFAVFPNVTGLLFVRVVFPWADVGNLYADYLEVKPGSLVVLKGTPVGITARTLRDLPGELMIRISRREGRGWGREFAERLPAEGYRTVADLREREWRYRVSCGPAVSRYYTVRVCEMPRYRLFSARLDFPAYVGRAPLVYTNEQIGAIQAIAGTRVTFRLEIDEPGTTGELLIRGKRGNLVSDDGRLEALMVSNSVAAWSMQLTNADGFKSPAKGGPFVSVPDQAPSVAIESPRAALTLAPHAKLPVEYTATDDVALEAIVTRCSADDDEFIPFYRDEFEGNPAFVKGRKEIDLSLLDLGGARRVRFDFIVTDRYPAELGGPHSVTSAPVTVNFNNAARSYEEQTLESRMTETFAAMSEAEQRLETAERLAREAKGEADRCGKVTESAEKKIEQLAHEVAQAEKRAEEIAAEMEEDGRFAPIVEELRDFAANELAPVREKVQESQFAAAGERVDALERVQPMLREADQIMKAAEAELRERKESVAAYERMKDLSDRQDALAKAAAKLMAERPVDAKKLDAWKGLEESAARLAGEINRKADSDQVEAARRKMELAAAKMQELRDDIALANDKTLKDEQKAERRKAAAEKAEKAKQQALKTAVAEAKRAEEMLVKARERAEIAERTLDVGERAQRVRESEAAAAQARDAGRKVQDALVRAEASEPLKAAEESVLGAIEEAREQAADRAAELREALAAQKAVRLALETDEPLKDRTAAAQKAEAETHAKRQEAIAELAKAETAAAEALTALRRNDGETAVRKQALAEAALGEAREALPANAMDVAEKSIREARASGERAKANPNSENFRQDAVNRQRAALKDIRAAADALAEAEGAKMDERRELRRAQATADRIVEAQTAAERAEKTAEEQVARGDFNGARSQQHAADVQADRALGLIEAQKERFERLDRDEVAEALGETAELQRKAIAAQADAAAARESAAKASGEKAKELRAAAVAAQKAAAEAQRAAEQSLAKAMEGAGVSAAIPAAGREPSEKAADAAPEKGSASDFAREAADDIRDAVQAAADELGIEAAEDGEDGAEAETSPEENAKGGPSARRAKQSKGDESARSGGGGVAKVMKELEDELRKNRENKAPEKADSVSRKAWFRIRGTVKEGLGEGALKDVPAEYRELVRRYFLRLTEDGSTRK